MRYRYINYIPYYDELNLYRNYRMFTLGLPHDYFDDMFINDLFDDNDYYQDNLDSINVKKSFTSKEASQIANMLDLDFSKEPFDLEQFRMGLDVELEHGRIKPKTNISNDDPIITGKIALAHLNEIPDYYTRLKKLENEAKAYWSQRVY